MQYHASCAAKDGAGVMLIGPPNSGKSDLLLRLIDRGFILVGDDRIDVNEGVAQPPASLAGMLEVRGLGILKLPYAPAKLALVVELRHSERLPEPKRFAGLPLVHIDPTQSSAPVRVMMALRVATGEGSLLVGALG